MIYLIAYLITGLIVVGVGMIRLKLGSMFFGIILGVIIWPVALLIDLYATIKDNENSRH